MATPENNFNKIKKEEIVSSKKDAIEKNTFKKNKPINTNKPPQTTIAKNSNPVAALMEQKNNNLITEKNTTLSDLNKNSSENIFPEKKTYNPSPARPTRPAFDFGNSRYRGKSRNRGSSRKCLPNAVAVPHWGSRRTTDAGCAKKQ